MDKMNHQTTRGDCGPVSIYNALTHLGVKCEYQEVLDFCIEYGDFNGHGMYMIEVIEILELLGVSFQLDGEFSIKMIENIIDQGKSLIFLYRWYNKGKNGGHFVFIDGQNDSEFRFWNGPRRNKTPWIKKTTVMNYLQYSHRHHADKYTLGCVIGSQR